MGNGQTVCSKIQLKEDLNAKFGQYFPWPYMPVCVQKNRTVVAQIRQVDQIVYVQIRTCISKTSGREVKFGDFGVKVRSSLVSLQLQLEWCMCSGRTFSQFSWLIIPCSSYPLLKTKWSSLQIFHTWLLLYSRHTQGALGFVHETDAFVERSCAAACGGADHPWLDRKRWHQGGRVKPVYGFS